MSRLLFTEMEIYGIPCFVSALEADGQILELNFEPKSQKSILGNIYVGQVEKIVPNIQSAFIQIQKGISCYYSLKEQETAIYAQAHSHPHLVQGDQILVQVAKEAMKGKVPRVTTKLNFTGTYLILTTDSDALSYSAKLSLQERKRVRALLDTLPARRCGIIVRTNAKEGSDQQILEEYRQLHRRLDQVLLYGKSRTCFSLLDEADSFFQRSLRNTYTEGLEKIVTDIPQLYQELTEPAYWKSQEPSPVRLYKDSLLPMHKLYRLERVMEEMQREKVWLKSGGFLVIQQTEAFVSIDVNSGKFAGRKKAEETYRKINLEAAAQIAYQLRLRNLSGIILIDFINMARPEHREELLHVLQKHLRRDPVKAIVVDMTKLNIVEVTRKKMRCPLQESFRTLQFQSTQKAR